MSQDMRLALVLVINVATVAGLLTVGLVAHSLGVLASGADYLGDALGTALSLAALRLARDQHGHSRASTLAAMTNSGFLLIVTLSMTVEAIRRLATGAPTIRGLPVVVISLIAAGARAGLSETAPHRAAPGQEEPFEGAHHLTGSPAPYGRRGPQRRRAARRRPASATSSKQTKTLQSALTSWLEGAPGPLSTVSRQESYPTREQPIGATDSSMRSSTGLVVPNFGGPTAF